MSESRNWVIDHTGIGVADITRSTRFFEAALRPLGIGVVARIDKNMNAVEAESSNVVGIAFGIDYPSFWIDVFHPHGVKQHIAFRAISREAVDFFHHEGLLAGGTDNGAPGLRTGGYPPGYYAAFLFDPDGNNIEAIYREPEDQV